MLTMRCDCYLLYL